ncbi:MAG TPA: polysaccharide deacetylase family protein [Blastocatellia bacterium]|nr:polysaccharide deacetylase family protein [Blastocatellia bacterium]
MKQKMNRASFSRAFLLAALLSVCAAGLRAQTREVAVTIDDLPLNGPQFEVKRLQAMTATFLAAIKKHQLPVVGFVNESLLYRAGETDARIAVLKLWVEGGVELGNHTFSHLGFANAALADYEDDFLRGDTVTRMLMKPQRPGFFRHPFLQMAGKAEAEKAFEDFIASRGYRIAPVTVDILDWMIASAYAKARAQGDAEALKRISDEFVKFAERKFDYCEQVASDLFGRPIRNILLLHANELTAENLDALATMLKNKGYRFIPVGQALQDPIYQGPETYQSTSDWLSRWAQSKGKKLNPPMPPDFLQQPYLESQRGRR